MINKNSVQRSAVSALPSFKDTKSWGTGWRRSGATSLRGDFGRASRGRRGGDISDQRSAVSADRASHIQQKPWTRREGV